jgi:hypothetical protein
MLFSMDITMENKKTKITIFDILTPLVKHWGSCYSSTWCPWHFPAIPQ